MRAEPITRAPVRVLHIAVSVDPRCGGPSEGILQISKAWRDLGQMHDIASMDPPESPFIKRFPGTVYPLGRPGRPLAAGGGTLWKRFGYTPGAIRWIRDNIDDYDAVFVSTLWNYGTMASRWALARYRKPYFVIVHGGLDPWLKRNALVKTFAKRILWLFNEGVLLRRASIVFFSSEEERMAAENAFWPYKLNARVIPYALSDAPPVNDSMMEAFAASVPNLAGREYLLSMGRLHPVKACDLLIRAFARHARSRPKLDLVMAGPDQIGWQERLRAIASEAGVAERVHWPGMLSGDAKWGAYHGAAALILPSHRESFGLVAAEALSCSKPVLLSDKVGICREIESDGAALVQPDTEEGVSTLIGDFFSLDEGERAGLCRRARASFLNRYHADKAARAMVEIVQQTIEGCRAEAAGGADR